jgi:hypothetical protein
MQPTRQIPPRRRGGNRWFIAVLPGQATPEATSTLAATLEGTSLSAGEILRYPGGRLFRFGDERRSHEIEDRLGRARIRHVRFTQAQLDAVPDALDAQRVVVAQGQGEVGPYRGTPPSLEITVHDRITSVSLVELRLAVFGKLRRRESRESVTLQYGGYPPTARRLIERSQEDHRVLQLFRDGAPPIRVLERVSIIDGLGLLLYDQTNAMTRLCAFVEKHLPTVDGYQHQEVEELSSAAPPAMRVRDNALGWDEFATMKWVIWSLSRGLVPTG